MPAERDPSDNAAPEILSPNQIIRDLCNRRRNSDIRADDKELRALLESAFQRLTESRDAISALFPDDAPHKHPETGVSLIDEVRDLIADRKRIAEERDAARTETAACVRFLETELGWEDFRAEGFIGESAVSLSTRNCQKLRAFLAAKGDHGVKVLAELSALRAELAQVRVRLEEAERDTKRLDWVEVNHSDVECCERVKGAIRWEVEQQAPHWATAKTLRAAIDAAISATTAEPEEGNNA